MENYNYRFHVVPDEIQRCDWSKYSLIMPTISVGQVGQLTVDLLLNNYGGKFKKMGTIYSDAILPIVGRHPDGKGFCMGLELHMNEEYKLIVLQQRAPFIKGRIPSFRKFLLSWIKECGISKAILVSGVSSHIRKDAELVGSPFRFITNAEDLNVKFARNYEWREYIIKNSDERNSYQLPGSGMLKSMYEDCTEEKIPFCGCLIFCNPGNTIREAIQLFEHVIKVLDISIPKVIKMPASWNLPGNELPSNYIF